MITVETLIAAGINPTQARMFADPLQAACGLYSINTTPRIAAFIAQCSHESAEFAVLEENLYYSTPERIRVIWPTRVPSLADAMTLTRQPVKLANRVYANRNGNADEASGDGWMFRGRGLIQITGRSNYKAATTTGALDYESHPDLVAKPFGAVMTAARWWALHGCNEAADASNIDAITRIINGPKMAGAADRRENYREALTAFA